MPVPRSRFSLSGWLPFLAITLSVTTFGQALTIPGLSRARDAAQQSRTLTDTEKKQVVDLYGQAIQSLENTVRFKAAQLGQERLRASLEGELAALRAELMKPAVEIPPPPSTGETAQQVQEALALAQTERSARAKAIDDLTKVSAEQNKRRDAIQQRRAEILNESQSLDDQLAAVTLTAASPDWAAASRARIQAQKQELEQEQASLTAEKAALEVRRNLIPLQRENAKAREEAAELSIEQLKGRLETARQQDALRELESVRKTAQAAVRFSALLAPAANDVQDLAARLWGAKGTLGSFQRTASEADRLGRESDRVVQVLAATRRLYDSFPPFSPARDWLRQIPRDLPHLITLRRARLRTLRAMPEVQRDVVNLEDRRVSEAALELQINALKSAAKAANPPPDPAEFETRARTLLQLRRNLIEELLQASQNYEKALTQYDRSSGRLMQHLAELISFASGRILWTRSVAGSLIPSPIDIFGGIGWFVFNREWLGMVTDLLPWKSWYLLLILLAAVIYLLFHFKPRLEERLRGSCEALADAKNGLFVPLRSALLHTILLSSRWPAVLLLVRWILRQAEDYVLARAIAAGLAYAAGSLFACLFARRALADGGIADAHLRWAQPLRETLAKPLRWLTPALPTCSFVVMALAEEGVLPSADLLLQRYHDSLGRLCFLLMTTCLLVAAWRVLRPEGAFGSTVRQRLARSGNAYWRLLSRPVMIAVLLAPIVMALAGYYVTGLLFARNMFRTGALTVVLGFTGALIFRWRHDKRLRLAAPSERTGKITPEASEKQVRQLSLFGLTLLWIIGGLWIWSAALPALTLLRQVQLLPRFEILSQEQSAAPGAAVPAGQVAAGPAAVPAVPLPVPTAKPAAAPPAAALASSPLLLYDVLLAAFVGLLVSLVVKNVPGLLEFTVMQRFDFDAGAKYAISTIARYIVIIIGVGMVSGILGVEWSKVQWLAAALTFGIGFGLQEIFANFASGLILLLDRSVRVGDAVTVGTLSGRVSQIQMRATTITLWDRSEMIVPNKEFITSKLVNWTLSYPETRVDIKVGVDYNTDTDLVRRLLREIADANRNVLRQPPPEILLTEFAASSINFELRVFCLYEYGRGTLMNELHEAVLREFRKHSVSIAFPQLDVRVKAVEGQTGSVKPAESETAR